MSPEFINMTIGVAIGATPFAILWAMANRRARDWQYLAEDTALEADRACHSFNSLYAQYLRLVAINQRQKWDGEVESGEEWKHSEP